MIAWNMIIAMFRYSLDLEQGGYLRIEEYTDEQFLRTYFGYEVIKKGKFTPGRWVYYYNTDNSGLDEVAKEFGDSDVIVYDGNTDIWLWRIEDGNGC